MKTSAALLMSLLSGLMAAVASAATAYVSDELVLGVFSEQNGQGQRLTTLHSGANVETLSVNGEYTQVRLNDGQTGWVKTTYLTNREPATSRLKQLEEELDRTRATTPALAEAAAHSEVERLKKELASKQSQLDSLRAAGPPPAAAEVASAADTAPVTAAPTEVLAASAPSRVMDLRIGAIAVVVALGLGFWLGYATLARRVKLKFGGIKVY